MSKRTFNTFTLSLTSNKIQPKTCLSVVIEFINYIAQIRFNTNFICRQTYNGGGNNYTGCIFYYIDTLCII